MALRLPLKAGHTLPTSAEEELHLGKAAVAAKKGCIDEVEGLRSPKDHLVVSTACMVCRDSRLPSLVSVLVSLFGLFFWLASFSGCPNFATIAKPSFPFPVFIAAALHT